MTIIPTNILNYTIDVSFFNYDCKKKIAFQDNINVKNWSLSTSFHGN